MILYIFIYSGKSVCFRNFLQLSIAIASNKTNLFCLGKKVKDFKFSPTKKGYAIKEPVFSFSKFPDVNKELGPEMKSTGEAIYFIDDLHDEYFQNVYSERNLYLSK